MNGQNTVTPRRILISKIRNSVELCFAWFPTRERIQARVVEVKMLPLDDAVLSSIKDHDVERRPRRSIPMA